MADKCSIMFDDNGNPLSVTIENINNINKV